MMKTIGIQAAARRSIDGPEREKTGSGERINRKKSHQKLATPCNTMPSIEDNLPPTNEGYGTKEYWWVKHRQPDPVR
jgi:hypothetical protein